jgi:hypothetical protein
MWNPWKVATIGVSVLVGTTLIAGLVVGNWSGRDANRQANSSGSYAASPGVPTQTAIVDCNQVAGAQVGRRDKTGEVVKDTAVGALIGAAVGAASGAIAGGGKDAGKGAAIGGVVGAGGGTLYGLNDSKKHDEAYRTAYARCMASHGYRS